jgi:formylglycine-generating enzyme required for sulfatase activity
MAGNTAEWVEDYRNDTYEGAPTDGSPWLEDGAGLGMRVTRGGSFINSSPSWERASCRYAAVPGSREPSIGFRCIRTPR